MSAVEFSAGDSAAARLVQRLEGLPAIDDGLAADARFRATMRALGEDRAALLAALPEADHAAFREALGKALPPLQDRLLDYLDELIHLADGPDDDQWQALCVGRSALQFLIDDRAICPLMLALCRPALARLDALMRAMGERQGPVPADERPDGIPESHGWWFLPAPPGGGEAAQPDEAGSTVDADRPGADPEQARAEALALAQALRALVEPMLLELHRAADTAAVASLQPRPDDFAKVFTDAALAARAAATYATLWASQPPVLRAAAPSSVLRVQVCPAGLLRDDNELSQAFPGGYRHIAPWLQPNRVWVAWKLIERGASTGTAYDGLVWIDDHWAWFPKPFRLLAAAPAPQ